MPRPITRRQFVKTAASAAALAALGSCTRYVPGLRDQETATARPRPTDIEPPPLLVEALGAHEPMIQADAARLLGDLRTRRAVEPLVRYVTEDRHYTKTAGLDALGRIGDAAVCPRLRPLVAEPNCPDDFWWYGSCSVQVAAAVALLALGDDSGARFLIEPGDDHKQWAQFTWFGPAILRLPDSPAARKVKACVTAVKLMPEGKTDPGQIVVICDALGLLGTPEAQEKLRGLLDNMSRYVRARAAMNLAAASGREDDMDRVAAVASGDATWFARTKAAQALFLRGRGLRYAEQIARTVAGAVDPFDRAAALDSLGIVGRAEYAPLVAAQLGATDAYVRLCAAEALDRIGGREAVAAVARLRDDPDLRVRLQVAKSLAAHGT